MLTDEQAIDFVLGVIRSTPADIEDESMIAGRLEDFKRDKGIRVPRQRVISYDEANGILSASAARVSYPSRMCAQYDLEDGRTVARQDLGNGDFRWVLHEVVDSASLDLEPRVKTEVPLARLVVEVAGRDVVFEAGGKLNEGKFPSRVLIDDKEKYAAWNADHSEN